MQRLILYFTFPWVENAEPFQQTLEKNKNNPAFWSEFLSVGGYRVDVMTHSKDVKH